MADPSGLSSVDRFWLQRAEGWSPETTTAGSAAEERAALLRVDRKKRAQEQRAQIAGKGHARLESWLDSAVVHQEEYGDMVARTLEYVLHGALRRGLELGTCVRSPRRLVVCATDEATVAASCSPFPDESSLVLVSEGLMGLIDVFSKQFALGVEVRRNAVLIGRRRLRQAVARDERADAYHHAVDVAVLRWRLLHQRVYGNSASLRRYLPDRRQRVADLINYHALRFVLAHEAAHHVLGHDEVVRGFSTTARLQPCVDDVALESAADARAIDVVAPEGVLGAEEALGALVAVMSVEYFESATLTRRVATHPEPLLRATRVLERTDARCVPLVTTLLDRVRDVGDRAAATDDFVPASFWKTMWEADDVLVEPHSLEAVQQVFEIDKIVSAPLDRAGDLIDHLEQQGLRVGDALHEVRFGSLEQGLLGLRVRARSATGIVDPQEALSFSTIVRAVGKGLEKLERQDEATTLIATLFAARLVEARIKEVERG